MALDLVSSLALAAAVVVLLLAFNALRSSISPRHKNFG
jgi:hypothetical protein